MEPFVRLERIVGVSLVSTHTFKLGGEQAIEICPSRLGNVHMAVDFVGVHKALRHIATGGLRDFRLRVKQTEHMKSTE